LSEGTDSSGVVEVFRNTEGPQGLTLLARAP
jgi:hypothetical protein